MRFGRREGLTPHATRLLSRGPVLRYFLLAFAATALLAPGAVAQRVDLIQVGDPWKYMKGRSDPAAAWTDRGFDDSSWSEGRTGIGYAGGDDVTVLADMHDQYQTLYARRSFTVDDPRAVRKLIFRIGYDDGFVAYVNGTEILRRGLGAAGSPVHHDTAASRHEAGVMDVFDVTPSIASLVSGENILAVETHNNALSGDDLSFVPALRSYGPAAAVIRGPYLQRVTESSVLVVWETDPAGTGGIEYGPTDDLGSTAGGAGSSTTHEIQHTDLAPGTEYRYRLMADGLPASPIHTFRTAPLAAQSRFRIAAFGDTEKINEGLLGAASLLESMKPDAALVAGDVIRGADADTYVFDNLRRVLPGCALYPAMGNHDLDDDGGAYFQSFYTPVGASQTERYYSFNRGNVHVVSLDVMGTFSAGSNQYKWLQSDLSSNDRLWTIAFLHKSPYSTGTTHGSDTAVRRELVPLFDQYKVDLVLSGHNHNYERTFPLRGGTVVDRSPVPVYENPQGTIYIVTGGAGGSLYAQSSSADKTFSAIFRPVNHVCQIDVDGAILTLKAIDLTDSVVETVEIRKSPSAKPVIGGFEASETSASSAVLRWSTDKPADSQIEYGTDGSFGLRVSDAELVTEHSLTIPGLVPSTLYQARARSKDDAGNEAVSDPLEFETLDLFVRGDSNRDGERELTDAVQILFVLFTEFPTPSCLDALDADDSGELNLTDAIYLLQYLFVGGPAPPAPYPEPGDDPTPDDLICRRGTPA